MINLMRCRSATYAWFMPLSQLRCRGDEGLVQSFAQAGDTRKSMLPWQSPAVGMSVAAAIATAEGGLLVYPHFNE